MKGLISFREGQKETVVRLNIQHIVKRGF